MPLATVYLLIGFIMSAIYVGLSTFRNDIEEGKAIAACYMIIMFWPILLPMFMVAGILSLKRKIEDFDS
jgi:hypothetical protein